MIRKDGVELGPGRGARRAFERKEGERAWLETETEEIESSSHRSS
jgi:hypothetical protein